MSFKVFLSLYTYVYIIFLKRGRHWCKVIQVLDSANLNSVFQLLVGPDELWAAQNLLCKLAGGHIELVELALAEPDSKNAGLF